ncbi:MAG: carbohydrate ABC transporter permease [Nitrososphaerales archaeon]
MIKILKIFGKYLIVIILFLIIFFPYFWLFNTSLKEFAEVYVLPPTIPPKKPTLENYYNVLTGNTAFAAPWPTFFRNSIIVASITAVLTSILASFAGYALSRIRMPGRRTLLFAILLAWMFPGPSILIPVLDTMKKIGLYNSLIGLGILHTTFALPVATWLAFGTFRSIPKELEEAAMIEGASRMKVFLRIAIPLGRIGITSIALLAFLLSWTEFVFALVLMPDVPNKTLPLGLVSFTRDYTIYWMDTGSASILFSLPIVLILILAEKQFVKGMSAGALKA